MGDLPVIALLSASQVQGVQSGTAVRTATGNSSILISLPAGTFLTGVIVSRDKGGNPVMRTDKGDITLKSDTFLKMGSEIVIRVDNIGEGLKARIISIDGLSPSQAQVMAKPPEDKVQVTGQTPEKNILPGAIQNSQLVKAPIAAPHHAADKTPEIMLKATVVSGSGEMEIKPLPSMPLPIADSRLPLQPTNPLQPVIPGTILTLKLITVELPSANSQTIKEVTPPTNFSAQPQSTPTVPSQNNAAYGAYIKQTEVFPKVDNIVPLPINTNSPLLSSPGPSIISSDIAKHPSDEVGSHFSKKPLASTLTEFPGRTSQTLSSISDVRQPFLSPSLSATMPSSAVSTGSIQPAIPAPHASLESTPMILAAKIMGTGKPNETLLQTPLGLLRLETEIVLHPNSRISVEIIHSLPPALPPSATTFETSSLSDLSRHWQSLINAMQIFHQHDSTTANAIIQRALPTAGDNLTSGMLFFMSALKGGNIRDWLGNTAMDLLEKHKPDLVGKLSAEFSLLRNAYIETPATNNWNALIFPIYYQGELQQARLFIKKEKKQNDKSSDHTRFMLEVDFSHFGEMQLDGLVRREERIALFDLVIRTLGELPQIIRSDITKIFHHASELTGFKGNIDFQVYKELPVGPYEEIFTNHFKGIVA